ncbi:hypothetical protein ACOMHN_007173 [Nucella lapillus]
MGKDKDGMSKEELAHENERLSGEVGRLTKGMEEVEAALKRMAEAYQQSKAAFTLSRYGDLKDMIKQIISDDFISKVQSLTDSGKEGAVVGLLQRARELADSKDGAACKEQPQPAKSTSGSKLSGFFKKIKQATGFSDNDPKDIRVLDKEDIRRDNERKMRELKRLNTRGQRALTALQKLRERYHTSKKHAPPKRYQDLKDMIKDILAEQI